MSSGFGGSLFLFTCLGVSNAGGEFLGGEATKHRGMNRTDPRTSQHCDHRFRYHRHVDHNTVTLFNADGAQVSGQVRHLLHTIHKCYCLIDWFRSLEQQHTVARLIAWLMSSHVKKFQTIPLPQLSIASFFRTIHTNLVMKIIVCQGSDRVRHRAVVDQCHVRAVACVAVSVDGVVADGNFSTGKPVQKTPIVYSWIFRTPFAVHGSIKGVPQTIW